MNMKKQISLAVEHMLNNDLDYVSVTNSMIIMRSGNVLFNNVHIGTIKI